MLTAAAAVKTEVFTETSRFHKVFILDKQTSKSVCVCLCLCVSVVEPNSPIQKQLAVIGSNTRALAGAHMLSPW